MIEPLKDNIVVKPVKETPKGVVLPERAQNTLNFGIVWLAGPDVKVIECGDLVLIPTWNEDKLIVDGVEYDILTERSISVRII